MQVLDQMKYWLLLLEYNNLQVTWWIDHNMSLAMRYTVSCSNASITVEKNVTFLLVGAIKFKYWPTVAINKVQLLCH